MPDERQAAALKRAAHYRKNAAQLRRMAQAEPHEGFNYQLLELARSYEQVAESIERWELARQQSRS
jgi:hypothetical protein